MHIVMPGANLYLTIQLLKGAAADDSIFSVFVYFKENGV